MPYVSPDLREDLDKDFVDEACKFELSQGELNYVMTRLGLAYIKHHGMGYSTGSEVIAAFECAKQEFYRRVLVPYEDQKIRENGDVYPTHTDPRD